MLCGLILYWRGCGSPILGLEGTAESQQGQGFGIRKCSLHVPLHRLLGGPGFGTCIRHRTSPCAWCLCVPARLVSHVGGGCSYCHHACLAAWVQGAAAAASCCHHLCMAVWVQLLLLLLPAVVDSSCHHSCMAAPTADISCCTAQPSSPALQYPELLPLSSVDSVVSSVHECRVMSSRCPLRLVYAVLGCRVFIRGGGGVGN